METCLRHGDPHVCGLRMRGCLVCPHNPSHRYHERFAQALRAPAHEVCTCPVHPSALQVSEEDRAHISDMSDEQLAHTVAESCAELRGIRRDTPAWFAACTYRKALADENAIRRAVQRAQAYMDREDADRRKGGEQW